MVDAGVISATAVVIGHPVAKLSWLISRSGEIGSASIRDIMWRGIVDIFVCLC